MPLSLTASAPTVLVRKEAFERAGLTRAEIDRALTLTKDEFRVEGPLIAIGPIYDDAGVEALVAAFEGGGLVYFDDFFEMSGNWPGWITVFAKGA
ncbi:MAG: hypothetical protein HYR75_00540 [Gemmatimonadetes bacterium]|nr:hypothetical protein [Gemmatimonadota bacterium]MBI3504578.1 hypothetical protein [Pseudomonadota bacterium]